MKEEIINIIVEVTGDNTILENPDVDLFEADILDSLAFINLITFIEEKYDIEIEPTEIPYITWTSSENITKMIEEKMLVKKQANKKEV